MLECDRSIGPDRFTAIGIAKVEDVAGLDGVIGRNYLDDLVLLLVDMREYPERQVELPAAVFKQGPESLGKRQVLRRGDFMQCAQCMLGLPAFGDFILQRLFRLFSLVYFRLQPGIARG
jgi:hypothetical protein